jgi:hypothetical protein
MSVSSEDRVVELDYINHRGERHIYRVVPVGLTSGPNSYHPDAPWLIHGVTAKGPRTFDPRKIRSWDRQPWHVYEGLMARIAELERQNHDLQVANTAYLEGSRAAHRQLQAVGADLCDHDWVDATNQVVSNAALCMKCGKIANLQKLLDAKVDVR